MKRSLLLCCVVFFILPISQTAVSNPLPGYSDDGDVVAGNCQTGNYFAIPPDSDTTFTLTMTNNGDIDNNFSISINYTDGSGWLFPDISSGVIPSGQSVQVEFTAFSPPGAVNPSAWRADIEIAHEAPNDNPRIIPICLGVGLTDPEIEFYDLETTCKSLRITNTGLIGGESAGLGYFDACTEYGPNTDAGYYLYSSSPVFCYLDGNDTVRVTSFGVPNGSSNTFVQQDTISVDSSDPEYICVSTAYGTADSGISVVAEYYAPKDMTYCDFIFQKLEITSNYDNLLVGQIFDWNVPSDSGTRNGSGYDPGSIMIYQYGAEYNQDDSVEALCGGIEADDRFGAIASYCNQEFKNAITLDNGTYISQGGPYGADAPLPPGPIYQLMADVSGYQTWSSADPDSLYTDLSTLTTYGEYQKPYKVQIGMVLISSRDGLNNLHEIRDSALAFIEMHGLGGLLGCTCCIYPGDTNNDGVCNVGDAVYIIGFIFKGGTFPPCYDQGDANGDGVVNLGDAVYIINYVFKGGPDPICPPYWLE